MADELTQAMIEEAMARAEKVACAPLDPHCYAFPDPLEDARETCTPKGRCTIGWIVSNAGGQWGFQVVPELVKGIVRSIRRGIVP